ncbi:unnamed protein product [Blepharisma stoltei]|uniref:Partial AB-hydrolase lipase domain-containing protein n=1 Tax=Blepharisma stoltei TaxID=1481888 RepID=A0AAU9JJY2_9CILI|nr:unnamed protein product [Blepharisma stoltei]
MWIKLSLAILVPLILIHVYIDYQVLPKEAYLSFVELAQFHGYSASTHKITTEDGYILTMYRLFKGQPKGKPVILMHGLFSAADAWISNMRIKGPAYQLIDAGFDVWLPNCRGSIDSRSHISLDINSHQFWNFSAIDTGRFDLPPIISFIKSATGVQKVSYVGHSLGGAIMLSMLSLNPKFENDLDIVVSLAGGSRFSCNSGVIRLAINDYFLKMLDFLGMDIIVERPTIYMGKLIKGFSLYNYWLWKDNYDPYLNEDSLDNTAYYSLKYSAGTSVTNLKFVKKFAESDTYEIKLEDFGPKRNLELYGREEAGQLDHSKIKIKVAIFGGKRDHIVTNKDLEEFSAYLPENLIVHRKYDYDQDHSSFFYGTNLDYLEDLINVIKNA